ncbi:MAG: hypothetical protein AB7U35_15540, partial [Sphingobium sp.]
MSKALQPRRFGFPDNAVFRFALEDRCSRRNTDVVRCDDYRSALTFHRDERCIIFAPDYQLCNFDDRLRFVRDDMDVSRLTRSTSVHGRQAGQDIGFDIAPETVVALVSTCDTTVEKGARRLEIEAAVG